jgi:hypothetical protein
MSSRIVFLIDIVIALWIVFGMSIVSYVILPKNRNTLIHLILLTLYCAIFCTFEKYFNNLIYLILTTIAIFIASHLKQFKDPNRSSTVKIYTNATLGISLFLGLFYNTVNNVNVEFYINNYWIIAVVVASYVLAFVKTKFKGYKIIAYLFLNILLYLMAQKYELHSLEPYIIGITTLGIALLDLARKELSDDVNKLYLLCSYILSCLILSINANIWQFIMMIVLTVLFYAYKKRRNINRESIGAIPLVVFIPSIYLSEWITIGTFNPMIIASIILIVITTMLSISKKELSVYLIISALYIVMQYSTLINNDYLLWIMLAVWSFLHIRSMKDNKFIFRVLLYVSCLLIYLKALTDINLLTNNLLKFNALNYLGFIVFGILLLRNVVKDLFKDYKLLEYAYFAILYLYALINYINEIDGMIFVFFVIVFVIYSYKKKYGPAFFTSGVAIVVNAFMLTRTFWFSIPWWIYMLVVGSALIVFAVKNELNEQKHRKMLKDKVKAFKDYMDM